MLDFQPFDLSKKAQYDRILMHCGENSCEYSFANLYLWGRQRAVFHGENLAFFSQFNRQSVYLFPVGPGDLKATLDAVIADSKERGIPCRLTSLSQDDCALLEQLYPGQFRYHFDRDSFDYIYAIEDLATLKGRKFQKKRNHLNRFLQDHPDCHVQPITEETLPLINELLQLWYDVRKEQDATADFYMEQVAIQKALRNRDALDMESLVLLENGKALAFTLGSRLNGTTFDVHFEKALEHVDNAYAAINYEFARYLMNKYPDVQWLNREDDLGIEGLRKAKLSYNPDHMVAKNWACLLEDGYEY